VYVYLLDRKSQPVGPYPSLDEVMRFKWLTTVTGLTTEVRCPEMETRQLAKLLTCSRDEPVGFKLKINGEYYVLTPARIFGRCKKQDGGECDAAGLGIDGWEPAKGVT
jgi:hypothetical protein